MKFFNDTQPFCPMAKVSKIKMGMLADDDRGCVLEIARTACLQLLKQQVFCGGNPKTMSKKAFSLSAFEGLLILTISRS